MPKQIIDYSKTIIYKLEFFFSLTDNYPGKTRKGVTIYIPANVKFMGRLPLFDLVNFKIIFL